MLMATVTMILVGANDHDHVYDQDGAAYLIYGRPYSDFATESFLSAADAIFYGASENAGFADDLEGSEISMVMTWQTLPLERIWRITPAQSRAAHDHAWRRLFGELRR